MTLTLTLNRKYEFPQYDRTEMEAAKSEIFTLLREKILSLKISASSYIIGGEGQLGEMCIDVDGSMWVVFSSERGERFNCALFSAGINAANYFLAEIARIYTKEFPPKFSISSSD